MAPCFSSLKGGEGIRQYGPQQFVIPGRRAATNPEAIFQRLVFLDSGFAAGGGAPE